MKRVKVILSVITWFCAVIFCDADPLPNDHGHSPITATVLSGTSNSISGLLEFDTDVDVFSFPFRPWMNYTIAVETGSVWDVELTVIPPVGSGMLWMTNSIDSGAARLTNIVHQGAKSRWYLAVSGMFGFTTGTYHVTVWEHPGQDTDDDGIADAWEMHYFGDLESADAESDATGDGLLDAQAYFAGIDPFGTFGVTHVARLLPDQVRLDGTLAPHGTYDLLTTTDLRTNEWQTLRTWVSGLDDGSQIFIHDANTGPRRFYQLRFRYE